MQLVDGPRWETRLASARRASAKAAITQGAPLHRPPRKQGISLIRFLQSLDQWLPPGDPHSRSMESIAIVIASPKDQM